LEILAIVKHYKVKLEDSLKTLSILFIPSENFIQHIYMF
jgi:hypothetical protein